MKMYEAPLAQKIKFAAVNIITTSDYVEEPEVLTVWGDRVQDTTLDMRSLV